MAKDVSISLVAQDKTARAFASVQQNISKMGKASIAVGARVAKAGAAMGAAYVAAQIAMAKVSMQNIDALAKTADKLGVTTEALSGLRHAAELSGIEATTFDKALQSMGVQIANAAQGSGVAKDSLEQLGLSAANLTKLPLDQQMAVVADAMQGLENHTDKVRIAYELFGGRGTAVLNMMKDGGAGMKAMAAEAEALGISVNRVDAAQIEAANDAVTRAKGVFTGLSNQLAISFSPLIQQAANDIRGAALDSADFGNTGQTVADRLVKGYAKMRDGVQQIVQFLVFAKGSTLDFAAAFLEVGAAINRVLSPVDKLIDAYNALAEFLGKDTIRKQSEVLDDFAAGLRQNATETFALLDELIAKPPESVGILETYEKIKVAAREAAEVVAANAPGSKVDAGADATAAKLNSRDKLIQQGAMKLADFEKKTALEKTQFVIGQADTQMGAMAANSKKMFAVQKAFQIAQALVNTYAGATQALAAYPPPLGPIMAGMTVAAGLAQVGQIRSQSFDGGGFTGSGSRSGGVDGKGGFNAILHPNESVIDHTKGQGAGGVTVVNNIDATGAGADVEMKIRRAVEQAGSQTIATIQDLMRRRRFA